MATETTFKERFYKLFAADLTANTFVECLLLADEAETEIARLRAALQEADTIMGHDDSESDWREKWAHLWTNVVLSGAHDEAGETR